MPACPMVRGPNGGLSRSDQRAKRKAKPYGNQPNSLTTSRLWLPHRWRGVRRNGTLSGRDPLALACLERMKNSTRLEGHPASPRPADPTCQHRLAQFLPRCQLRVHPKSIATFLATAIRIFLHESGWRTIDPSWDIRCVPCTESYLRLACLPNPETETFGFRSAAALGFSGNIPNKYRQLLAVEVGLPQTDPHGRLTRLTFSCNGSPTGRRLFWPACGGVAYISRRSY
jgi:hypothetical protein